MPQREKFRDAIVAFGAQQFDDVRSAISRWRVTNLVDRQGLRLGMSDGDPLVEGAMPCCF
jgi:hypothetical protein